ncbi:MAG: DUF1287 domain-containing protein, partial [Desulfobacteraceae bacterium]|nr:DUF1287 domain-containing protein [Desulfobacteraceae bacterium]
TSIAFANDRIYPIVSHLNVREQPGLNAEIIDVLHLGKWVEVIEKNDGWTKIYLSSKKTGYVSNDYISDIWIKVLKKERKLLLFEGNKVKKEYPIALGFNPLDDKVKQGDGCTPEGRFYICEMLDDPKPESKYGARSMRVSYPDIEDARRGLKDGLIKKNDYLKIVRGVHKGQMPTQNTILGGSIRIHGGGIGQDWTLGCIAMNDEDIKSLYSKLPSKRTLVEIYKNRHEDQIINKGESLNNKILKGAKELFKTDCKYTKEATSIIRLKYPMGDIDPSIGVCTDIVIRALRYANIDLQALLYEDIILHPEYYPSILRPNTNIDHRRTRNLKIWFDHNAETLTNTPPKDSPEQWRAGDIVLMDTGVNNGTIYDHIGILSDRKINDVPLVINLWTIGYSLEQMDLLQSDYPKIVGHYRLTN